MRCAVLQRDGKLIASRERLWLKPLGKPHRLIERHNLAIVVVLHPAIVIFEARQLPLFPVGGLLGLGVVFFKQQATHRAEVGSFAAQHIVDFEASFGAFGHKIALSIVIVLV